MIEEYFWEVSKGRENFLGIKFVGTV